MMNNMAAQARNMSALNLTTTPPNGGFTAASHAGL
jgi:hypothetical protein